MTTAYPYHTCEANRGGGVAGPRLPAAALGIYGRLPPIRPAANRGPGAAALLHRRRPRVSWGRCRMARAGGVPTGPSVRPCSPA